MSIWETIEAESEKYQKALEKDFPMIPVGQLQMILAEGLEKFCWSTEEPAEPGWYWAAGFANDALPVKVIRTDMTKTLRFYCEGERIDDREGFESITLWAKIPSPDEIMAIFGWEAKNDATP